MSRKKVGIEYILVLQTLYSWHIK